MNPQEPQDLTLDPEEIQDLPLDLEESQDPALTEENPELELDFDLDDIIKEFSEPELTAIMEEFSEEPEIPPAPSEPEIQEPEISAMSQETAVFQPIEAAPETMPELETEPEPEPEPATPSPLAEPFSDEWEPEYEMPMGEYPHPIQFPSKNRQGMLRKKLVAGPEKRYHALMSKGLGKLQFAIFMHFVLLLLSGGITAVYLLGIVPADLMRLVIYGQVFIALVAGLLGCNRLLNGIGTIFRGRFNLNSLLLFTFLACMADCFFCLQQLRLPYTTLLCLALLMAQWAEYQRFKTQVDQMDTLRKALEVTALVKCPDFMDGKAGYRAVDGDPDAFMQEYHKPYAPETHLHLFALLALLCSVGLAVYLGVTQNWPLAIQVLSAALLTAMPASAYVTISRPAAILERRLHRLGAVLCGWKGIRDADIHAVYPLEHDDLFPAEYAKMNGVKFYGTVDPGRVVSYAAALIACDGPGMLRVFSHLPRSRNIHQHQVTDFMSCPGGITGLVDGWHVMVGTQEFLTEMGIPVPAETRIPQAVYAAVEGQFCAVFALQYTRSKSSTAGLRTLCGYGKIQPVLTACDFLLTDQFIRGKLSVNIRRVLFPTREERQALRNQQIPEDATVVALATRSGLAPKAYALTGARTLRVTMHTGSIVHILAGAVGLAAVAVLALTGGLDMLTMQNLLAYNLIWMVPGLLITEWTRHI